MATYVFYCPNCDHYEDINVPVSLHEFVVSRAICECGTPAQQVITSPKATFIRMGFPNGIVHEHLDADPIKLRDKKHFQAVAQEKGWTSTWFDGV